MSKHDPPPVQDKSYDRTQAIIVRKSDSSPIPNAQVKVTYENNPVTYTGVTDVNGYIAFLVHDPNVDGTRNTFVSVVASGYKDYLTSFVCAPANQDVFVGGTILLGTNYPVLLPNLVPFIVIPQGIVSVSGKGLSDGRGIRNFLGASLFVAPIIDRTILGDNLDFLVKNKVDYIRILCEVGGSSWEDRTINPNVIDFGSLFDFINSFGLRISPTIFGGTPFSTSSALQSNTVLKLIDAIKIRSSQIHFTEVANESFANFPDLSTLRGLAQLLQANTKNLVATSSPNNDTAQDDITKLYNGIGSIMTMHLPRTNANNFWEYVRAPWGVDEFINKPSAWSNSEGVGPYSSGVSDSDVLRLAMYAAVTWGTNCGDFLLHNGAGIRMGGAYDVNRGLPVDYISTPGIQAIFDSINYVRDILPSDSANWIRSNDTWNSPLPLHPLRSDVFWSDGASYGPDRNYSIQNANRYFTFPCGILDHANLTARNNCHIKVHDVVQKLVVKEVDLKENEVFVLQGSSDTHSAFIIEGVNS